MHDLEGPVDTQSLRRNGMTPRQIRNAVATGELTRVRRGWYVARDHASPFDDAHVHLRRLGPGATVCGLAAALAHGLPVPEHLYDGVRATRPKTGGGSAYAGGSRYYSCPLDEDEVVVIDGVRVTSLARTVVDCCRHLPSSWGLAIADAALRQGLARAALTHAVDRSARRPGNAKARWVVSLADARAESVGESRSRAILCEGDRERPRIQVELHDEKGFVGRVDFLFDGANVVGEFDGQGKYELDPRGETHAREVESARQERLEDLGWTVVRWT